MMKEDMVSKLCTRTNNVKHQAWKSDFMCVCFFCQKQNERDVLDHSNSLSVSYFIFISSDVTAVHVRVDD